MLHELFLALSGYRSTLFDSLEKLEIETFTENFSKELNMKTSGMNNLTFGISRDNGDAYENSTNFIEKSMIGLTSVFHPCEIQMMSEILRVGKCYMKIKKFYDDVSMHSISVSDSGSNNRFRTGYYLTTFATAVYEETNAYRKKVIELEQEYLKNPNLLLTTILINVNVFKHPFFELCHWINVIENGKFHGCKILDFLHKEVILSVGETEIVLKRITFQVQKVLIDQLTYWLIYGELLDPHEELFLKVSRKHQEEQSERKESELTGSDAEVCLSVDMLPEFISLPVAEKIVFIGEHILCFEKERERVKGDQSSKKGLILKEREMELLNRFELISHKGSFSLTEFQDLIENVRLRVSQHIYSLVMNAGLITELNHIKDIFLLGRGELYQAFFMLSENKRPSITNINSLFHRAGRQILMEESVLDKFIVTYDKSDQVDDKISVWKNLRINYQAKWPLYKFFDTNIQEKYNVILRFLLDVREAQLRLQYLFISQKGSKAFRSDNLGLLCWTIRHHMSLLIGNLQYYIQADVLESQFGELRKHIDNSEDYQRLCFYHQSFLSSVITQCFLSHPLISFSISSLLEKVKSFCNILEAAPSVHLRSQIECVKEEFDSAAAKIFWALKTLCQKKNTQHTAPLILKIDYNNFYSRNSQSILDS